MIYFITPCYKENDNIILKNIRSIQKQRCNQKIFQKCIFDGVPIRSTILSKIVEFENVSLYKTKKNHADYGDYVRRLGTKVSMMNKASCIGYLDADNTIEPNHVEEVLKTHENTKKNIVISRRNIISSENKLLEENNKQGFFDTNTITFFNDLIKIGLLWGRYPNQLSLIGDRIISKYIKKYHFNDIAFTNQKTVNYSSSKISLQKTDQFKHWFSNNQSSINETLTKRFGFKLSMD